jgi:hypothetical protein
LCRCKHCFGNAARAYQTKTNPKKQENLDAAFGAVATRAGNNPETLVVSQFEILKNKTNRLNKLIPAA